MDAEMVKIEKVSKQFGAKQALKNIHLTIQPGEILGLVGPNGAGKTTLISVLMGLVIPDSGTVRIFGKERNELSRRDRSQIGFVPDEINLYEWMTIEEILRFQSRMFSQWDQERCDHFLHRFGLNRKEKIRDLSKGMRSQLALILALCTRPKLLILDEPLEGLDPVRRLEFLNLVLEDFLEGEDCSVLISSHYLEELERMADRIAFISDGVLQHLAPMEQIKSESKTIRVVFQKEPPEELLQMSGIRDVQREGKLGYLITVEENFSAVLDACAQWPHFVLDTYHRSLDELFSDYTGSGDFDD